MSCEDGAPEARTILACDDCGRVQSCVWPVCAAIFAAAGPDVVREAGPDHQVGFGTRDTKKVFPSRRPTDQHQGRGQRPRRSRASGSASGGWIELGGCLARQCQLVSVKAERNPRTRELSDWRSKENGPHDVVRSEAGRAVRVNTEGGVHSRVVGWRPRSYAE